MCSVCVNYACGVYKLILYVCVYSIDLDTPRSNFTIFSTVKRFKCTELYNIL